MEAKKQREAQKVHEAEGEVEAEKKLMPKRNGETRVVGG